MRAPRSKRPRVPEAVLQPSSGQRSPPRRALTPARQAFLKQETRPASCLALPSAAWLQVVRAQTSVPLTLPNPQVTAAA